MSIGVATTANASPRLHTAAHRRRVGDFMDCEKSSDCYLLNGVDYEYDYDYDHNDHWVIRYLWLLSKMEAMRGLAIAHCLVLGRNVGRTIFAALMMMAVVMEFPAHTATVNDLCFDIEGEYIGSCSDDGSVVISSLFTDERMKFDYHRPMKAIALDPDYARKSSRRFVAGGLAGHLYFNTKKWMGYRDQVLHSGEGPIHAVKWRTSLIAWANDAGVKVYDSANDQRVTFIERPRGSPRPELLLPHLVWQDDVLLVIGWGTSVKIASIRTNQNKVANGTHKHIPMSSMNQVDIVASFQTSYFISGIAPFGDTLVVLAYIPGEGDGEKEFSSTIPSRQEPPIGAVIVDMFAFRSYASLQDQGNAQRPEVRVVTWNNDELATDALPVHGFEHYKAKDYALAHAPFSGSSYAGGQWAAGDEPLYYIVSPKDVVIAKPRDAEDHISWLLQHGWHEKALAAVEAGQGRSELLDEVGSSYLDHLIVERKYTEAASLCPKLLRGSAPAWERWVFHFAHLRQLPVLVPYIPTENPRLRDTAYEVALVALTTNPSFHKDLSSTVKSWPPVIYSALPVISAIEPQLNTSSMTDALGEALAELYVIDGRYEKAFALYADLMKPDIFDFLEKHSLHDALREKVGSSYLDHLIVERKYTEAASLCPKLLRGSASAWERWVFHFAHLRQLPVLVPYIPTENPRLRDTAYEVALVALTTNPSFHKDLLSTVKSWPPVIYSALPVISAIEPQLNTSSMTDALGEALAELYVIDGRYEKAFALYADLMKPDIFDFLEKHNLHDALREKVVQLMMIDCKCAVPLLTQHRDLITASEVVSQLLAAGNKCDSRYLLHLYLHSLFEANPHAGRDFHDMQVELYADYDQKMLLPFLRSSQHYTLEKAYEICVRRDLLREQVFILGRMGNPRQALVVIINKLGDIEEAIEFVSMQHDDELWEELIKQCFHKPEMVGVLLEHTVGNLDPLYIVNIVPNGLEIPRLRDRLVKIITDYRTETSLRHGCNDILKADCVNLLIKYYKEARRAIYLSNEEDETRAKRNDSSSRASQTEIMKTTEVKSKTKGGGRCCICFDPFSIQNVSIIVFFCCHTYHTTCLLDSINAVLAKKEAARPTSRDTELYYQYENGDGDVDDDDEDGNTASGAPRMRCILCTTASS
ncbi:hypothetical protein TEA_010772 [Camellia sinensis var. sinensis]|uniref:Vacuolar protein sorting-associated protein 41 homolog n=1 Tax=Camellia sinensis var. sinensis TaxID=542762 RepID=A0A4S4CYG8_CAMSN|nr:hypothetical protein TEA_010772 [Camellia sinensis var. sinensis]